MFYTFSETGSQDLSNGSQDQQDQGPFMHLYTLADMSVHESCLLVCHPYFNTMKVWTSDPNLNLSPVDITFCLFACLLAGFFVLSVFLSCQLSCLSTYPVTCHVSCYLPCFPCLSCLPTLRLFPTHFVHFLSIACLLVSYLCLCMYTYRAKTHELGHDLLGTSKMGAGASMSIWAKQLQPTILWFSFSLWLCTILNPSLPPPFLS